MTYFNKYLKDNEELIAVVKQHPLVFLKPGLIAVVLLSLPFFLMFLLFKWETFGLIIFFIMLVVGIIAIIKLIVIFSYNAFLITNQRVILFKQVGLFERSVSETDYGKIQDISYRIKGLGQTLFRYGSIRLQIMGSESPIIVSKIPKPREVQQLILKIKNHEEVG